MFVQQRPHSKGKRQHLVLRRKRHESEGERGQTRWRGRDATCFDDEREDPRQAHDRESALTGLEGIAQLLQKRRFVGLKLCIVERMKWIERAYVASYYSSALKIQQNF